ncbi:MAG: transglycosylase SLT domain-containing protein [Bacteroidetes bacterium]|nr:transglycosylase SLT domain-containing protein [Bacteroidota bacterium]MCW5895284.1 transglycosylase SLT domain-containing protein [Bacteroidota bacterium]
MERHSNILLAFAALVLVGCTPTTESVVKRAGVVDGIEGVGVGFANVVASPDAGSVANTPKLDWASRNIIRSYGDTIKKYSERYGFDWRLTLSVMKAESSFIDSAESEKGAQGLMQIMPGTQEYVVRVLEIDNAVEPRNNIRAGIFYLSRLYRYFEDADENDRLRLTLAAYNAGPGRVFDAQEVARYLNSDPTRWQSVRDALPLLSSRYYTLHENVWPERRPKSGSFGGHRETVTYVEKIMNYYDEYRLVLD